MADRAAGLNQMIDRLRDFLLNVNLQLPNAGEAGANNNNRDEEDEDDDEDVEDDVIRDMNELD